MKLLCHVHRFVLAGIVSVRRILITASKATTSTPETNTRENDHTPARHSLSLFFDTSFYLSQLGAISSSTIAQPLEHYLRIGWRESRNPHPFFDVRWYLDQNPDVAAANVEPFDHYLSYGWKEGRQPHPRFDGTRYLSHHAALLLSDTIPPGLLDKHSELDVGTSTNLPPTKRWISYYPNTRPYPYLDPRVMAARIAHYRSTRRPPNRIALCTCIMGNYDTLRLPEHLSPDIDYFLFTDRPTDGYGVFQVRVLEHLGADSTRTSRHIKLHPHHYLADYDMVVWCDANIIVRGDLRTRLDLFAASGLSLAFSPHPLRKCLYQEAVVCVQSGKDRAERIVPQMLGYQCEGYPFNHGLIEANFFACRPQRRETRAFFDAWWDQLTQGSQRDQLSVNYVLWKQGLTHFPLLGEGHNTRTYPGTALLEHGTYDDARFAVHSSCPTSVRSPFGFRSPPVRTKASHGPMNILFINYGDHTSNSLNHIAAFADTLSRLGHACVIALSECEPGRSRNTLTHAEVVANPACFPDGRTADIIHAWTPREPVRRCLLAYQRKAHPPARLVIHLEDNEQHILATYVSRPFIELAALSEQALSNLALPGLRHLSHPRRHQLLLYAADAVTCITPRLMEFVPAGIPAPLLPPGLDASMAHPIPADPALRNRLGLHPEEKVIVYPGGANHANAKEIRTLYAAVSRLNREGIPTRLIHTGPNPPQFGESLTDEERRHVIELGFVERAQLPRLLALADVLVQPGVPGAFNDYRLPSKLPEFLASGRPVILPATNIASDMKDGREAVFLRDGSASDITARCRELFADPVRAARIGADGRAFAARHFDLETNTCALLRVYESVRHVRPAVMWRLLWIPGWDETKLFPFRLGHTGIAGRARRMHINRLIPVSDEPRPNQY